ncbi:MAG TPA: ketoacyl-ACP synthase III [Bacteroidia bacterium]|nr:ketoacyl-ACP synthase III [Bacteroidia bacterium]
MAHFNLRGAKVSGVAATVPKTIESNRDYELITDAERAMFVKTTGIEQRHVALHGETTGDLCVNSAEVLLRALNWSKDEIDLLIFVSQSPDHFLPATSIIVQDRLGLKKTTASFDINLGCSGYVYGLSVASSMMATGGFRKALLLVGDISTAALNRKDKSTWPLFGDCGTATAIEYNRDYESFFNLQSDGSGKDAIIIPHGGIRNPITPESLIEKEYEPGVTRHLRNLWLNGLDVFNFSVREAPPNVNELLQVMNKTVEDIDFLVMHQANFLMNETIRKKLKFPAEKVPYTLKQYGNTSSASIPLTLVDQFSKQPNPHNRLLLASFGVGLSWGSCYLETDNLVCPPVQLL